MTDNQHKLYSKSSFLTFKNAYLVNRCKFQFLCVWETLILDVRI